MVWTCVNACLSVSKVLSDLNASLNQADLISCSISITTVIEALSHLKLAKSDGTALVSNHFICASSILSAFLSKLFTAMLRHGYVPKSLRDCILQPIPKPGKDFSVSDNYRSIALAPTLSKVFEWCILIQFHAAFVTSSLQFGFKLGVSTDLCTGLGNFNLIFCLALALDRVGRSACKWK